MCIVLDGVSDFKHNVLFLKTCPVMRRLFLAVAGCDVGFIAELCPFADKLCAVRVR